MDKTKTIHEPLFHVVKRPNIPVWKKILYYAIAIIVALLISAVFCAIYSDQYQFGDFFYYLFDGIVGTKNRPWMFIKSSCLLLGVSLALLPAFKMKFWNLGANGQILISCLTSFAIMLEMGHKGHASHTAVVIVMILSGVSAGIIWALIPALFKAFFNTNETLFTLMMNYVAEVLVALMIAIWFPSGSGKIDYQTRNSVKQFGLPDIGNKDFYILIIFIVALLTVFSFFYLKKSKHGYELSVVGESENTAKYAGMNVKKIIIRTMILSGAICGIIGVLLTGNLNHSVSKELHDNMGFTAIIAVWLAQFNPLATIGTCFLIAFISCGMANVQSGLGFTTNSIINTVIGFTYFFIIACSFFINYKLVFKNKHKSIANQKFDVLTNYENKKKKQDEKVAQSTDKAEKGENE